MAGFLGEKDLEEMMFRGTGEFIKFWDNAEGILGRAPTVGDTFKPVPQPRLEVPARTGRHRFSQQRRLPCDSNWGANPVKPLKGTPLPVDSPSSGLSCLTPRSPSPETMALYGINHPGTFELSHDNPEMGCCVSLLQKLIR
ncbi:hypothetical protein WN943_006524 [Citrus x changshan-huyou]